MNMMLKVLFFSLVMASVLKGENSNFDWFQVDCDEYYEPENCVFEKIPLLTIEDFERCGPAHMTVNARNYIMAAAPPGNTYVNNKRAFRRIRLLPKMLRGSSVYSLKTTVLGMEMDFPIGFSPTALHKLADPDGEISTVQALKDTRTVMILNCYSSTSIEEVAAANEGGSAVLWMHTYFFDHREDTLDIVRRAEVSGYKAIVVTVDNPIVPGETCDGKMGLVLPPGVEFVNVPGGWLDSDPLSNSTALTFEDLSWLSSQTRLPVIAKGILSPDDAVQAALAGAAGILVSNEGGRNLDTEISTIDALPGIVDAVSRLESPPEVYLDSGVRSGTDVYKALARGAKMVFVGRPVLWGLAMGGSSGVKQVLDILTREFNDTMILSGSSNPSAISKDTLIPAIPPSSMTLVDY